MAEQIPPATQQQEERAARMAFYVYFLTSAAVLAMLVRPFLTTLLVAAVFGVWMRPVYLRWVSRYPRPTLVALALTALVFVAVLIPLGWVLTKTFIQVGDVADNVSQLVSRPEKL